MVAQLRFRSQGFNLSDFKLLSVALVYTKRQSTSSSPQLIQAGVQEMLWIEPLEAKHWETWTQSLATRTPSHSLQHTGLDLKMLRKSGQAQLWLSRRSETMSRDWRGQTVQSSEVGWAAKVPLGKDSCGQKKGNEHQRPIRAKVLPEAGSGGMYRSW